MTDDKVTPSPCSACLRCLLKNNNYRIELQNAAAICFQITTWSNRIAQTSNRMVEASTPQCLFVVASYVYCNSSMNNIIIIVL